MSAHVSVVRLQVLAELQTSCSRHAPAVLNVLRARRREIRLALLSRTNCMSSAVLQDFDWNLKVNWAEPQTFMGTFLWWMRTPTVRHLPEQQYVQMNHLQSKLATASSGGPQGSKFWIWPPSIFYVLVSPCKNCQSQSAWVESTNKGGI